MNESMLFPNLPDWESTYKTLHLYSLAVGVVPRTHAQFHPKWWHIGLKVQPDGLRTTNMSLPGEGHFWLEMNLRQHKTVLYTNRGLEFELSHTTGLSGTEFGNRLLTAVGALGLTGEYARKRFENDEPGQYDPVAVERFLGVLVEVNRIFNDHRSSLEGDVSPVNFWTHGFDLAFEWFGTRLVTTESGGKIQEYPAQINFGYFPREDPYFYSNPWPFEAEKLLDKPLPTGASWFTEGWQGTILPYNALVGVQDAEVRLRGYLQAVYDLCSPMFTIED